MNISCQTVMKAMVYGLLCLSWLGFVFATIINSIETMVHEKKCTLHTHTERRNMNQANQIGGVGHARFDTGNNLYNFIFLGD